MSYLRISKTKPDTEKPNRTDTGGGKKIVKPNASVGFQFMLLVSPKDFSFFFTILSPRDRISSPREGDRDRMWRQDREMERERGGRGRKISLSVLTIFSPREGERDMRWRWERERERWREGRRERGERERGREGGRERKGGREREGGRAGERRESEGGRESGREEREGGREDGREGGRVRERERGRAGERGSEGGRE